MQNFRGLPLCQNNVDAFYNVTAKEIVPNSGDNNFKKYIFGELQRSKYFC
jgi:hypothetical protein